MTGRVGVIGSNMIDLVTSIHRMPGAGETLEAPGFAMGHGGKGANQAVAAARMGARTTMVSRVGDDSFGRDTLRNFQRQGIDTRHVHITPGLPSGVAPIFIAPNGENAILIVKGANNALSPADVDEAAPDLLDCDMIVLQLETALETVYHAIDWATRNGKPVLLNPAPASRELSLDRIVGVDFFMPNQTELAILTGMPTDTRDQAEAAARSLTDRGIGTVVVTLGADGALLVQKDAVRHFPAVNVRPRDTSGAGDAFIGAFAYHYTSFGDLDQAIETATRYAALSVTRDGTQKSFGTAAEFKSFCASLSPPAAPSVPVGWADPHVLAG